MKKFLLILILSVGPAHAVKLCKYNPCSVIDSWKNASGGTGMPYSGGMSWSIPFTISPSGSVGGQGSCSGNSCSCRVTSVNGNSCSGGWVVLGGLAANTGCAGYCAYGCASCAASGDYSCTRSALFANVVSNIPDAAAVTCPINGTCENTNYKTVGDSDSCGDNWVETTSPTLTISGEYSDGRGTFTYTGCHP